MNFHKGHKQSKIMSLRAQRGNLMILSLLLVLWDCFVPRNDMMVVQGIIKTI
jgi:hypothetical protein